MKKILRIIFSSTVKSLFAAAFVFGLMAEQAQAENITVTLNSEDYAVSIGNANITESQFFNEFTNSNPSANLSEADLESLYLVSKRHSYIKTQQPWNKSDTTTNKERYIEVEKKSKKYLENKGWKISRKLIVSIGLGVAIGVSVATLCVATAGWGCVVVAGFGAKFGVAALLLGVVSSSVNGVLEAYDGMTEERLLHKQLSDSKSHSEKGTENSKKLHAYLANSKFDFSENQSAYFAALDLSVNQKKASASYNYLSMLVENKDHATGVDSWIEDGMQGTIEGIADHFSGGVYSLYSLEQRIVSEDSETKKRELAEAYIKVVQNSEVWAKNLIGDNTYVPNASSRSSFKALKNNLSLSKVVALQFVTAKIERSVVTLSGYVRKGNGDNPRGKISFSIENVDYEKSFNNFGSNFGSYFKIYFPKPSVHETIVITATTDDGYTAQVQEAIRGDSSFAGGVTPNAIPVRPSPYIHHEYSINDVIDFVVKGADVDKDDTHKLKKVEWIYNKSQLSIQEESDIDTFSKNAIKKGEGTESAKFIVKLNENFTTEVKARVIMDSGVYAEAKWQIKNKKVAVPTVTATSYVGHAEIVLGKHTFAVDVTDEDNDLQTLFWYLDGNLVETDTLSDEGDSDDVDLTFSERKEHQLVAVALDASGAEGKYTWNFIAGTKTDASLPTKISFKFGLKKNPQRTDFVTYKFKPKHAYSFSCDAVNADPNLVSSAFKKDGVVIKAEDNRPDRKERSIRSTTYFASAGTYELECAAKNNGGFDTAEKYKITVVDDGVSSGTAPQISRFYPKANHIYAKASSAFKISFSIKDLEHDQHSLEIKRNGSLIAEQCGNIYTTYCVYGGNSGAFPVRDLSVHDGKSSGTYTYTFTLVDIQGNRGNTITKTVTFGGGSNHSPSIEYSGNGARPVYVVNGESSKAIRVIAEDVDGNLDKIIFDATAAGGSINERFVSDSFSSAVHEITATRSGLVYFKSCDESGACSTSSSIQVYVEDSIANHAPQILYSTRNNNDLSHLLGHELLSGVHRSVNEWDFHDPDGDLKTLNIVRTTKKNSSSEEVTTDQNYDISSYSKYYVERWSLFSNNFKGNSSSGLASFPGRDRGNETTYKIKVIDTKGNSSPQIEFKYVVGRTGVYNHAPTAVATKDMVLKSGQYKTIDIAVDDYESDVVIATIENVNENEVSVEHINENVYKITAQDDFSGTGTFKIKWQDGFGGITNTAINYNVEKLSKEPVFTKQNLVYLFEDRSAKNILNDLKDTIEIGDIYSFDNIKFKVAESSGTDIAVGHEFSLNSELNIGIYSNKKTAYIKGFLFHANEFKSKQKLTVGLELKEKNFSLNFTASNNGTVTSNSNGINCGSSCSETYEAGTIVTLVASANSGYSFKGWSGSCSGTSNPLSITIDSDKNCSAVFTPLYTLTINAQQNGKITANGINCGTDCTESYNENANVQVTANGNNDYAFVKWSGGCLGTENPLTIVMDKDKVCSAEFDNDYDNDNIPNSIDTDDDNDGMPDLWEAKYGLNPLDPSDANQDLDGDGVSNLNEYINNVNPTIDDAAPLLSEGNNPVLKASGSRTAYDLLLFNITAVDAKDGTVTPKVLLVNNKNPEIKEGKIILQSGRHILQWQAQDKASNVSNLTQTVDVLPQVNFGINQMGGEGNALSIKAFLTGEAPRYPIVIPFSVSGTATSTDYTVGSGTGANSNQITISSGRQGEVAIRLLEDGVTEQKETIIVTMNDLTGVVKGQQNTHTITIVTSNISPRIQGFTVKQDNKIKGIQVSQNSGNVTVTADVFDPNNDPLTYTWNSKYLNNLDTSNPVQFIFNPANANVSLYEIELSVSDSVHTTKSKVTVKVVSHHATHADTTDTDGDGILDKDEAFDSDGNGILDYREITHNENELSSGKNKVIRTLAGARMKAHPMTQDSGRLTKKEIADHHTAIGLPVYQDDTVFNAGEIYAYTIANLGDMGVSIPVVISLDGVPVVDTVLRKYSLTNGWGNFLVDDYNQVDYAVRTDSTCPDSSVWTKAQIKNDYAIIGAGASCLKVTIQDGGVNDEDGEKNGSIDDPIAVSTEIVPKVTVSTEQLNVTSEPGSSNVLAQIIKINVDSGSLLLNKLTLKASGSGNDKTQIKKVLLFIDKNANNKIDSGEEKLLKVESTYSVDDGELELQLAHPEVLDKGTTTVMISYDF